jgi:hypothetical protein
MNKIILLIPVCCICTAGVCLAQSEPDRALAEAKELVHQVLEAKRKIESGEIRIQKRTPKSRYGQMVVDNLKLDIQTDYSLIFKPDKIKVQCCYTPIVDGTVSQNTNCKTVIMSDDRIVQVPCEDRFAVNVIDDPKQPLGSMGFFHPRLLGICPHELAIIKNFEFARTFLLPDNAKNISVTDDIVDGLPMKKISFEVESPNYSESTLRWIIPERDYSVLRSESISTYHKEKRIVKTVFQTELKKYGDVWFPEKISTVEEVNSVVANEETVTTAKAVFNQAINDNEFSINSLGLPIGREVHHNDQATYWDGERLVDEPFDIEALENSSRVRQWAILLLINAVICGYVALRFYIHYKNYRNQQSTTTRGED